MRNALNQLICFVCILAVSAAGVLVPRAAFAGPYTKLQVLLPGESPAPGTGTGKTGAPTGQTVGVPFNVTVRACDDTWNTVTAVTNAVALSSTDGSASLPPSFSLVSGTGTVQVTLNSTGSFTVSATDNSDATIPVATSSSVASMLLQGFTFSSINQKNQYAGTSMTITIHAVNPSGQQVAYNGPVSLQEITSYGVGRIAPATITMSGGTWSGSVTCYRADETSINRGNVNVYAYLAADPSINGTSDPFTVHPGSFKKLLMILPGQDPEPGSVTGFTGTPASQAAGQPFSVDVYATDSYFNQVPSSDVARITSSDASTPVSGALTSGFRRYTFTLNTVGTRTLTVVDQTNGAITGMTSDGIAVLANSASQFVVDAIASPQTAGVSVNVHIRATDMSGNTVPGFAGSAVLLANTGPGSITPESITFTNGEWQGPITFKGAGGAVSFTVSDFAAPPHTGTSNSFVVDAGPVARMFIYYPGMTPQGGTATGWSGTPTDQQAGATFNMTVRAVDQYWNRVTGNTDTIDLSSTDAFANIPAQITLVNGELVVPIKMYKAGYQRVSASDADNSGVSGYTSTQIRIVGGTYSRIVALCPGETLAPGTVDGRTGTATDQSINYSFVVTVQATDQWFNPVTGVSDMIHLTSGDPLAQLPADQAMVDGVADMNVRLATGGFQQITAANVTQPAMPTSTTQVRAISSGFHLEAAVTPLNVQAGEQFTLTVKVTNDAGSVIQEINSFVTVEIQNASTQSAGKGTLLNTQFQLLQGQRSMAETYTFAEPIILIVHDDAGNAPAATEVITVTPGAPSQLKLSSNPKWVGGNKHATVSAHVMDAFNNGVADRPVDFSILSGNGQLSPLDSLTSTSGVARCDFRSPREPEVSRVHATSGALSADLDIQTALVDPNANGGYITNYPNPFHPGEAPTTIAYKLDDNATVTMRIFTLTGGLVFEKSFAPGSPGGSAGLNQFVWDGRNGKGDVVASGGYVLHIEAAGQGETLHKMSRKIAVVR
ncbi:MAG TPA: FlgD immunoglobulin-like domain containing protein [Candidatus Krumholzibacteria bacterium]|nr:FlgD immunoglobulin-like domain containing protein [Candidatus Krumholzibacteria bacterium]